MKYYRMFLFFTTITLVVFNTDVSFAQYLPHHAMWTRHAKMPERAYFLDDALEIKVKDFGDIQMHLVVYNQGRLILDYDCFCYDLFYEIRKFEIKGHQFIFLVVHNDRGAAAISQEEWIYVFRKYKKQVKYLMKFLTYEAQRVQSDSVDYIYGGYQFVDRSDAEKGIVFHTLWNPEGPDSLIMFGFGRSFYRIEDDGSLVRKQSLTYAITPNKEAEKDASIIKKPDKHFKRVADKVLDFWQFQLPSRFEENLTKPGGATGMVIS